MRDVVTAVGNLITSWRNFLIRASALTASEATVALPIITIDDARSRASRRSYASSS
jgi:hypothetical protein